MMMGVGVAGEALVVREGKGVGLGEVEGFGCVDRMS